MNNYGIDIETATEEELDRIVQSFIGESEDLYIERHYRAVAGLKQYLEIRYPDASES